MAAISETKRRRTFNFDARAYIGFVRRRFQKKYCQIYHTTLSDIVKAILQIGRHLQSNRPTSISETKRRRALNFDTMYKF